MVKPDRTVLVAVISAAALIIAAAVGAILQPSWWHSEPDAKDGLNIAGTVVDELTNGAVGQARISIVGRPETLVSEDNGNFQVRLLSNIPKDGYIPLDETTMQTDSLVIQLRRKKE
jgi:hypothetical protein